MNRSSTPVGWRDLLGPDAVAVGEAARSYSIGESIPQYVLFPSTVEQLSQCVATADAVDAALVPVGNGTQLGLGNPPQRYDVALSTRRLCRILAHEAADMTVTVEAGATLAEVNAALEPARQHLPLDPPHPERITIGGLIATDASGPLRVSQGKVRDLLIGIRVVRADGTVIRGGGRVVKNVAGYDLMKLFTGSFGTLGVVAEATFKVRPLPEAQAVFIVHPRGAATGIELGLRAMNGTLAPLYVEVLDDARADGACAVFVGCGGGAAELDTQYGRLRELAGNQAIERADHVAAQAHHEKLRDFTASDALPGGDGPLCGCRISVLPSQLAALVTNVRAETERRGLGCVSLCRVGSGVAFLRWRGDDDSAVQFATWVRQSVRHMGGWTMVDRFPAHLKPRIDTWDTDIQALRLMRGIKSTLDPRNRFSPGRFVGGI